MKKSDTFRPHSQLHWYLAPFAAVWLFLLLYGLDLRPPHHDEGINGWFVIQMWRQGFFRYDPGNYHGPLFFYLLQLSETFLGKGIISLRLVTVFFAIGNTLLVLAHRRFFGRIAIWAALAMAFSPAALFYGRYAIHETVFIFFQLLFSYGYFTYSLKQSWRRGVVCMTVGFFGTVLIKETFFIFFGTWIIALFLINTLARFLPETAVRQEWRPPALKGRKKSIPAFKPDNHRTFLTKTLIACAGVTLLIYSGFLMNPHGIIDMFVSFAPWLKTGMKSGHEKPFFYWLKLMRIYEWTALAALAAAIPTAVRTSRQGRFWCVFSVGCALAYAIIPYKTPWIILNMLWPLYFVLGYAVETMAQKWPGTGKGLAYFAAALLIAASAALAVRLNYLHCADPKEPYVYTHSHESINELSKNIERVCKAHPEAHNMRIVVAIQQTWPLPWTLSDYPQLVFAPYKTGQSVQGDVLLIDIKDQTAVEAGLKEPYYRVRGRLRDAYTDIVYYYKKSLFEDTWVGPDSFIQSAQQLQERMS